MHLSKKQWDNFNRNGFLKLGHVISSEGLRALQQRIDQIMLGKAKLDYSKMLMQLDSSNGEYGDLDQQTKGFKESTLNYRKIQQLEFDALFLDFIQHPLFYSIAQHLYQTDDISVMRSMFMNKPINRGTELPWHQDRWQQFNQDPVMTVWTALDPATKENGCVKVLKGSHLENVINPNHPSGFLTPEQIDIYVKKYKGNLIYLELEAGETVLLHNYTLHSSSINRSKTSRRAFSVCYMRSDTLAESKEPFSKVFGKGALNPNLLQAS